MYEISSSSFVLISIAALVMASVPALQEEVVESWVIVNDSATNSTREVIVTRLDEHVIFAYIEYVCVVYFFVE